MQHAVVPAVMIAERHRLGLDKADEMWQGVLHMNRPGNFEQQRLEMKLATVLGPLAEQLSLHLLVETGVFDPAVSEWTDFRTPDVVVFGDSARSERGVEGGALLAVEIRSPGDESFDKIPFYSRVGVAELLIIERDTKDVRKWRAAGGEGLAEVAPSGGGWHELAALPASVRGDAGTLQVRIGTTVEGI